MAPSSPVRGSHLSMMNNQFHQDQEQYEPLSLCSTYRDLALNDENENENENDNSSSSFDKSTTSASATVPHFTHDKYSSSSVAASPIRMKNNHSNKFAAASPLRMSSVSASALGASPLNTSTRRQRSSINNNTKSSMSEEVKQQQQTHHHHYHTRNDSIISIVEHAEEQQEQQQQIVLPSQANIASSSPPRNQHQYFNPFGDAEEDIDLNLSHIINSPTSATAEEDRHHAEAAAMLISPEATHHHHKHDDKKQHHERGVSGVQDLLGDLDDDDMMMMVDDSAEEVQRLRDLADERQQTIFDLQGQLSEAEEFQKDLLLRNETLQSEARSLRSAMADQGSALGEFLCFSPSSSNADRMARSEADCGEFSSPQRGTPNNNKNGNIKSHYQQLWLLQQHLQKSGDSILLRSPSSGGGDVLSRKEYRDAEISCDLESENNLSVSMRTVKKLPFGDDDEDENENDKTFTAADGDENDETTPAVDIPVNQVGGTYYLMPPKASHRNKRRQLHRNRAARSSKNLINISATRTTRTLSVVSSSSSYENSADRLRGGKINYKLMAKNSTAGNRIGGRFSFFRFLFEW